MILRLFFLFCIVIPNFVHSDFFIPLRLAFPCLCEFHFNKNTSATKKTWLEPVNERVIQHYQGYLNLIPRPYVQDCEQCGECGSLDLNCNNDFEWAVDDGFERQSDHHQFHDGWGLRPCLSMEGPCDSFCWDGGYFRKWNNKYQNFFLHHLKYCSENTQCKCFWPEMCSFATKDNDLVFSLLKKLADNDLINNTFSSCWIGEDVKWTRSGSKYYTTEYYPNNHGMASSLVTYTFFYSQYYRVLMDVIEFIDQNTVLDTMLPFDEIYSVLARLRESFMMRYNYCLREHPHPKIYYERGMLNMHSGDTEAALEDIQSLMKMANTDQYKNASLLNSEMYHQEGQAYAELGQYDKAIVALTEAINRDPNNKGAYFHRAGAYFEIGQFDTALQDFILSDKKLQNSGSFPTLEFETALSLGLLRGTAEAALDFVPSMCHSTYGLGRTLWTCATEPVQSYKNFAKCSWEAANAFKTYCQTVDWNTIEGYSQQLYDLYKRYDSLSDQEKGDLIGYTLAKYGTDFFLGVKTVKAVGAYKKLREANQLCNLEAALSASTRESITLEATAHAKKRCEFFKNVKIVWDEQNKHVPGKHNYLEGRSIFAHNDPESLLRKYAGKGVPKRGTLGDPGYIELVDFEESIGIWVCKNNQKPATQTTKGKIHYSKKGAHIVPEHPDVY